MRTNHLLPFNFLKIKYFFKKVLRLMYFFFFNSSQEECVTVAQLQFCNYLVITLVIICLPHLIVAPWEQELCLFLLIIKGAYHSTRLKADIYLNIVNR